MEQTVELLAVVLAIQGVALVVISSVCIWNFRRIAEISRAVTRIENEASADSGRQKMPNRPVSLPAATVQATRTV